MLPFNLCSDFYFIYFCCLTITREQILWKKKLMRPQWLLRRLSELRFRWADTPAVAGSGSNDDVATFTFLEMKFLPWQFVWFQSSWNSVPPLVYCAALIKVKTTTKKWWTATVRTLAFDFESWVVCQVIVDRSGDSPSLAYHSLSDSSWPCLNRWHCIINSPVNSLGLLFCFLKRNHFLIHFVFMLQIKSVLLAFSWFARFEPLHSGQESVTFFCLVGLEK